MAVNVSATATRPGQQQRHPAHAHLSSALQLLVLVAVTGLVSGLILAIVFVGVFDQLSTAGH